MPSFVGAKRQGTYDSANHTSISLPLHPRAAEKRDRLNSKIPPEWIIPDVPSSDVQRNITGKVIEKYLSAAEISITRDSAKELIESMTSGKLTAVAVVRAFCHRAAVTHQLVNCLMEIMFEEALALAAELDASMTSKKGPVGPFHGLPISLKDQFHVEGVDTCMGYVGWIGTPDWSDPTTKESELVREIRSLGGIPFCKTSVPTTLMVGETINNITGYTFNPYNRLLSSGGSSGGEGALIGALGSPLGVGTDIGGSIRIPASFNHLYGLRPSHGRFPYMGMANSMPGQPHVPSVLGPLSQHLSTITLFTKGILSTKPWETDPQVVELPWRDELSVPPKSSELCIGILRNDGIVTPHPPIQRAIDMVASALKKAGIKTIDWTPPNHAEGLEIVNQIFVADAGDNIHTNLRLSTEPILPHISANFGTEPGTPMTAIEIGQLTIRKQAYCEKYMMYWNSTISLTGTGRPVDGVIMPVAPHAAVRPGQYMYYGYSTIVNLLDYSSLAIPVTFADQSIDVVDKDFVPLGDLDSDVHASYDPEIYNDGPAGVQLFGRRFWEEHVIGLVEVVEQALKASNKASL